MRAESQVNVVWSLTITRSIAQSLSTELVYYDLDEQRILSYALKPWAERFLVPRMELYREECPDLAAEVEAALGEKESP